MMDFYSTDPALISTVTCIWIIDGKIGIGKDAGSNQRTVHNITGIVDLSNNY